MKAKEITLQIVKNLGNYETCRFEATYIIEDGEDLLLSFLTAKNDLEKAYNACYPKSAPVKEGLIPLTTQSKQFDRVCSALYKGTTDLEQIKKFYVIADDAIEYFKKHNLI